MKYHIHISFDMKQEATSEREAINIASERAFKILTKRFIFKKLKVYNLYGVLIRKTQNE